LPPAASHIGTLPLKYHCPTLAHFTELQAQAQTTNSCRYHLEESSRYQALHLFEHPDPPCITGDEEPTKIAIPRN